MFKYLLSLLFPTKCLICESNTPDAGICGECWAKLSFITKPYCASCSFPFAYENEQDMLCGNCIKDAPNYDKAISIMKYDEYCKKLIHKFKYQDQLHVLNYLTKFMINMGKELIRESDFICPVPMHKNKLLKRGYNQAALLAMNISKQCKINYLPDLIVKHKNIQAQAGLLKHQRVKNIKNSFQLNMKYQKKIEGKRILLIDDVITTGATITECCRMIRVAKPSKIFVLTLAKRL